MENYKIEEGKIKKEIEISQDSLLKEYNFLKERNSMLELDISNSQNEISKNNEKITNMENLLTELKIDY